ncbi:hypothetical protein A6J64_015770 [Yersinia enterocolitica]|nr:hypothetical protein YWA314_14347 [Yersinia enterocolitica subsp. enterocolitica WA-314]PNM14599.1 hypothetical protein A6J64_015770 [Yersinia enterocolitica]PNM17338.1 hypothetical protein A6J63_009415 [Yersinia enterocolitica]RLZ01613.1 hypothetical protein COO51_02065 [Yersinia enterocolitica]
MLSDGALSAAELFSEVIKKVPLVLKHHVHALMCLYSSVTQLPVLISKTELNEETLGNINIVSRF